MRNDKCNEYSNNLLRDNPVLFTVLVHMSKTSSYTLPIHHGFVDVEENT
jgi:hypothetical protein